MRGALYVVRNAARPPATNSQGLQPVTQYLSALFPCLVMVVVPLHAQHMAKGKSCDIQVLLAVDSSMAKLTPKLVEAFLLTH